MSSRSGHWETVSQMEPVSPFGRVEARTVDWVRTEPGVTRTSPATASRPPNSGRGGLFVTSEKIGLGIDVAKATVDFATSDGLAGQVPRTPRGLRRMLESLDGRPIHRAVVEASGGYERAVLGVLFGARVPVVLIQPARARHFAKALGRYAKTDAIDASVLSTMAVFATDHCPLWSPPSPEAATLRALVDRRRQLVTMRDSERRRRQQASAVTLSGIQAHIEFLQEQIQEVEVQLELALEQVEEFRGRAERLTAVRGVGLVTAASLLVYLPELGTLTRREVAALAGVAPIARESGSWSGQRFIFGGRGAARRVLYMATLAAIRHNAHIKAFFTRLRERGKKGKVAVVACMRKLLIHLNAELRRHRLQAALA